MAYLLGGKACMESLRTDVQDIHWTIADLLSRTGPVQHPSWKFPDKLSCDLDMDELLDLYDYSTAEDEEENQVAHIGLYELVIDRLVYFIQTMNKYIEQLFGQIKTSGDNYLDTGSSVGIIVKRYCSKLIHLHTLIQQLQSENKSKNRKVQELEKYIEKKNDMGEGNEFSQCISSPLSYTTPNISKDINNKSSQTIETAFIPCESCEVVQKNLRETGDLVVHFCTTQGLPSSLKKFRPQVAGYDWLSANDITRWTHEQNKDLSRINKFIDQVVLEVNPLKAEVAAFEKETKQMKHKVRQIENELKLEKETQSAVERQYRIKLEEKDTIHDETISNINKQKEEVINARKILEEELKKNKIELRKQQTELEELETKLKLSEREVKKSKVEEEEMERLENKVKDLNHQLRDVTDKLELQTKDYNMEIAKSKNSQKRNETLQSKQGNLLKRIDELDRENEEIKQQMNELEEERDSISEELNKLQEEKELLEIQTEENKKTIEELKEDKEKLKVQMKQTKGEILKMEEQLNEAKEREKLLIEYPDLNGPVNSDYKGTGDIVIDMENQVKANLIRVEILEKQSEGLQNSIYKFMSSQSSPSSKSTSASSLSSTKKDGPTQLWKVENMNTNNDTSDMKTSRPSNMNNNSNTDYLNNDISPARGKPRVKANIFTMNFDTSNTKTKDEFVVNKSTRPESAKHSKDTSKQNRPLSSKKSVMAPVNQSSIGAYLHLKKNGLLGRPPSGKTADTYQPSNKKDNSHSSPLMFVCQHCDKMYEKEKDLEIHYLYCTSHQS